jgi:hypothetical protein
VSLGAGENAPGEINQTALAARAEAVEESYEFFLAYASQGLASESGAGLQVRQYLDQFSRALDGLDRFLLEYVGSLGLDQAPYRPFIEVIARDAGDARAAVTLVLAQPSIHSQMIDNFNANIHVRALLTDLFLIDEILNAHRT